MIKKVLKQIGITLLVISYLIIGYTVFDLKSSVRDTIKVLLYQIDFGRRISNKLILDQIKMQEQLVKFYTYLKSSEKITDMEFSQLEQNIQDLKNENKPTDTQHIINTSVFVDGIIGVGSGTVIKKTQENMYILTCYHVIEFIVLVNEQTKLDAPVIVSYSKRDILGKNAGSVSYAAQICYYDADLDLAILKTSITDDNLEVAEISNIEPNQGDIVYSVGNPLGEFERTISKGILCNKKDGYYISDNTITFGNSGGGLFNDKGELIGIPVLVHIYGTSKEDILIPESSLGLSINLFIIKDFLSASKLFEDWTDVVAKGATEILEDLKQIK